MSGLELAASIAGFISLGIECCKGITDYCNSYQGAQRDVELLQEDTSNLMHTLQSLEGAMDDVSLKMEIEQSIAGIFETAKVRVLELSEELKKFIEPDKSKSKRKAMSMKVRILYPFQEKSLQKMRGDISKINEILQQATSSVLLRQQNKINDTIDRVHESVELDKIKDWLKPPDFSPSHSTASDKKSENTGAWFFNNPEFREWKNSSCSVLWVSGGAGRGKTVLCSTAINYLTTGSKRDYTSGIAYLYFDQTNHSVSQEHNMLLRSLVHQLSSQNIASHSNTDGSAPGPLKNLYARNQNGTKPPLTQDLMSTLRSLIGLFSPCYLVADALDECKDRHEFLRFINTIVGQWKIPHVRFLITSRSELDTELPGRNWRGFTVSMEENINGDVRTYVETTLNRADEPLNQWNAEERKAIAKSLIARANGNFRWVACQLEVLRGCFTKKELEQALESLPATLEDTYERTLAAVDESRRESLCQILRWLCFSSRPMRLDEMCEVLAIDFESKPRARYDPEKCLQVNAARYFHQFSNLMSVTTVRMASEEYKELRLAHLSVRDYVLSKKILNSSASFFYITEPIAQRSIAEACIIYLQQFETKEELPTYSEAIKDTPLARYAARYWSQHVQAAIKAAATQPSSEIALPNGIDAQQATVIILIIQFLTQMLRLLGVSSPVLLQISNNQDPLADLNELCVEFLVSQGQSQIRFFDPDTPWLTKPDVSRPLGSVPSALYTAAQAGFLQPVRQLLRQGMDPNVVGGRFGTPLQAAACKGFPDIVALLLENGADPNFRAGDYVYALQGASSYGHEACVKILLDAGAEINGTGGDYHTAIHAAAYNGHVRVIELLAEYGADIDSPEPVENRTPLTIAASQGHTAVAKFLLDQGADILWKDSGGWTALDESAPAGFEALSELLIKHNPDILKSRDKENSTALHHTASQNHPTIVELMLRSGIDPHVGNSRDNRTALFKAVKSGNIEVVQIFLKYGAMVQAVDHKGWTPLHIAAYCGFVEIGELLLENGADVDAGPDGWTPLHIAVVREQLEFIAFLLDNDADVMVQNETGRTAFDCLQFFEDYQNEVIIRRLHIEDNFFTLCGLRSAASRAQNVHVRDLLERGADINARDEGGFTAIYWAACKGHNSTVRLLIESGADVNVRNDSGDSIMDCWLDQETIDLAIEYGFKEMDEEDVSSAAEWSRRHLIGKEMHDLIKERMPRDALPH
ncbi:hypothetical protein H072_7366 [Dactylellina haptotyla CBS 200.50]|uniref:Nephrocystin 3-like N-terminal domain-containing protein n=1 Tax=Dactylellina haptotyla (strain CBS 200.50) TaxID=1284197 RepID=S8BHY5_DACHA|nr:hypothetical protein H072_7366 [Dactylellina haptotyla CBS 200.50]